MEGYYVIHTKYDKVRFYKDEQGLPYIDLTKSDENVVTLLVQTVHKNYGWYTKKEVLQAKEVGQGQGMIGSLSESDYKTMVSSNMISNCPISQHDVSNAHTIFGLDLTD